MANWRGIAASPNQRASVLSIPFAGSDLPNEHDVVSSADGRYWQVRSAIKIIRRRGQKIATVIGNQIPDWYCQYCGGEVYGDMDIRPFCGACHIGCHK